MNYLIIQLDGEKAQNSFLILPLFLSDCVPNLTLLNNVLKVFINGEKHVIMIVSKLTIIKMDTQWRIKMNINNKPLFEKATEDLNQLINSSFTRHIISISHDSNKENVNNILDDYKTKYPEENVKTYQSGRTWILIGQNNNGLNSLNAGQSQNIIEEIGKIVGAIIISKKGPYYELSKDYDELSFYEICNDEYIKKTLKLTEAGLRDLAYELSKDYLAEYLVAKNTAAKHWNYYGSGMDKRYYYHFDIENFR